jgi:hypothetical protein
MGWLLGLLFFSSKGACYISMVSQRLSLNGGVAIFYYPEKLKIVVLDGQRTQSKYPIL